jgi:hypothetical protein
LRTRSGQPTGQCIPGTFNVTSVGPVGCGGFLLHPNIIIPSRNRPRAKLEEERMESPHP